MKLRRIIISVLVIFFTLFISVYARWWYENYKVEQERQENFELAQETLSRLEEEARNDTYGGKTPEDTLQLFIEALENEDFDLASKYFVLDVASQTTRAEWKEGFEQSRRENRLQQIIDLVLNAKPAGSSIEGYFGFEIRDEDGGLVGDINMNFNEYSGVWKIQSL